MGLTVDPFINDAQNSSEEQINLFFKECKNDSVSLLLGTKTRLRPAGSLTMSLQPLHLGKVVLVAACNG